MEDKVQSIIMLYLSDLQNPGYFTPEEVRVKANFAKFLIMRYPNTLDKANHEKEFEAFLTKHPQFRIKSKEE